jgi:hypothetical protein
VTPQFIAVAMSIIAFVAFGNASWPMFVKVSNMFCPCWIVSSHRVVIFMRAFAWFWISFALYQTASPVDFRTELSCVFALICSFAASIDFSIPAAKPTAVQKRPVNAASLPSQPVNSPIVHVTLLIAAEALSFASSRMSMTCVLMVL